LGPVLFHIFINDIDKGVVNKLLKFADDTKLIGVVSNETEIDQLRSDLQKLYNWSADWQKMFNTDKCKSLHFGNKNVKSVYLLADKSIRADEEEKDLGIIIHHPIQSRKPLWRDLQTIDVTSWWREDWQSAAVVNSILVVDPTPQSNFLVLIFTSISGRCRIVFRQARTTVMRATRNRVSPTTNYVTVEKSRQCHTSSTLAH